MAPRLIKHGTENGYREEIKSGKACNRCLNAHRVFGRQYRAVGKSQGLKYGKNDVLDHLYTGRKQDAVRTVPDMSQGQPTGVPVGRAESNSEDRNPSGLADRLGSVLASAMGRSDGPTGDDYLQTDEIPDYLRSVDDDPEPTDSEYYSEPEVEYVLNQAGLEKIEENLGTYLSIVGMTAEMIDPYCGSALADNFENIVKRWTKVIAHYPKAAELFLDGKGGVIMTWIGAIQATWPVLMAIYHHHLARDIVVRDGRVFRRDGAKRPMPDATMPPMPDDFNYSAI